MPYPCWSSNPGLALSHSLTSRAFESSCLDRCFYHKTILEGYSAAMQKSKVSPGPCEDPLLQMCCCPACTMCVMYRELKLKPCGTPQPLPTFETMDRK